MKKTVFLITVSLFTVQILFSKTIYVAKSGNNTTGSSSAEAFTTLNAAKTQIKSGDQILLKRGDVFRETVDLSGFSNLTIDAFGDENQPKPIISGSDIITGWTLYKNNIYVSGTIAQPENLYVDNKLMLFARWPNQGWINIDNAVDQTGKVVISSSKFAQHVPVPDNYWKNARMRLRRWSWWFETPTIGESKGNESISVLNYSQTDNPLGGWKFYIDNKFEELDTIGEWIYNQNKAYVIPRQGNINSMLIEGAVRSEGLKINASTVRNLNFQHQTCRALTIAENCIIENCTFENIGSDDAGSAIFGGWSVKSFNIKNNTFRNCLNTAIYINQDRANQTNCYIEKNTFTNIGIVPGYGGTGSWKAVGILIGVGRNIHVQYNDLDTIGYAGILLGSDGNFAEYNNINAAMYTLNDGGGIYTNCSYSTIRHNYITNTRGNLESSTAWPNLGHGIWPEFLEEFHDNIIENNVVVNSGGNGIYHNNLFKNKVSGNVLYNNENAQIRFAMRNNLAQANNVSNNIFFAAKPTQLTVAFQDGTDYGTMNENLFANPYNDYNINGNINYAVENWSRAFNWADKTPIIHSLRMPYYIISGISKDRIANGDFENSAFNWINAQGTQEGLCIGTNPDLNNRCLQMTGNTGKIQCFYNEAFTMLKDSLYEIKASYTFNKTDDVTKITGERIFFNIRDKQTNKTLQSYIYPATTNRNEIWTIIKVYKTISEATIGFEFYSYTGATLNIDNVAVRKVTARPAENNELTQLFYNKTNTAKDYSLDETEWYNLDGSLQVANFSLAPYAWKIVYRSPYQKNLWFDNETTETNKMIMDGNLLIYPNPATDFLTLIGIKNLAEIKIYSMQGKLLQIIKANTPIHTISVQNYNPGLYLMVVTETEGRTSKMKFVKK